MERMPDPIIDILADRANDPKDNSATFTIRGEVLLCPGIYLNLDDNWDSIPEGTLRPYQGVDFITLPKEDAKILFQAFLDAAAKYMPDKSLPVAIKEVFGGSVPLSVMRLGDRLGHNINDDHEEDAMTSYIINNDSVHELKEYNVLG